MSSPFPIDDPDADPNDPPYVHSGDDSDLYDVWTPKAPPYSPITPPYSPITPPRSPSPMYPISRFPTPEPRSPSPTPRSPSSTELEGARPDFYDEHLASPYNGSSLSLSHVDEGYESPTNGDDYGANQGDETGDGFEDEGYYERNDPSNDPSQMTQAG